MSIPPGVQLVIGITHRLGPTAAEHDLHINRFETVVLKPMDDPRRAGDALPRPELSVDPPAGLVLDEHGHVTLQYKEHLLDLMGMRGVALAGRHIHDREGEATRRDRSRVVMLARAAGADKAVL